MFTRIWGIPPYTNSDPNDYYEESARQKNNLYKTMGDCQIVLRFFALDNDDHIQGSMKSMLDRCMERNIDATPADAEAAGVRYIERLHLANELFDSRPFVVDLRSKSARPFASVYDGVMVALDGAWKHKDRLLQNKAKLQAAYASLVEKEGRTGRLTGAANTAADIRARISLFKQLLAPFVS